jgi:hypothetical protein
MGLGIGGEFMSETPLLVPLDFRNQIPEDNTNPDKHATPANQQLFGKLWVHATNFISADAIVVVDCF